MQNYEQSADTLLFRITEELEKKNACAFVTVKAIQKHLQLENISSVTLVTSFITGKDERRGFLSFSLFLCTVHCTDIPPDWFTTNR